MPVVLGQNLTNELMKAAAENATMSWVDVVGRLLTDKALRQAFRDNASETMRGLGLEPNDAAILAALEPDQLEAQAQTLIAKRWSEVRRMLPRTFAAVGLAADLFAEYAASHWPTGHQRHRLDAAAFVGFLRQRGVWGVSTIEERRIQFANSNSRGFRIKVGFVPRQELGSRLVPGLHLLLGHANHWHEWILRLAI